MNKYPNIHMVIPLLQILAASILFYACRKKKHLHIFYVDEGDRINGNAYFTSKEFISVSR